MPTNLDIHPIQTNILLALLHKPFARFSQMNGLHSPSDQFNFHLKTLVSQGLVIKNANGQYQLSDAGKEFANRFDTQSAVLERQPKITVLLCCEKSNKGIKKYLVQQRLKQPYFGYYGFFGGKIKWGETIFETAKRELKEETGFSGELALVGVKHKMDYDKAGKLLEDKFFFVFKVTNLKGKLVKNFGGGKNIWLTKKEINKLDNIFDGVDTTFSMIKSSILNFDETKYEVNKY